MLKLPYCITFLFKSFFYFCSVIVVEWLLGGPEAVEAPGLIRVNKTETLKTAPTCFNKSFTNGKILILTYSQLMVV